MASPNLRLVSNQVANNNPSQQKLATNCHKKAMKSNHN